MNKTLVIIPTLNSQNKIIDVINELRKMKGIDILVIDQCSSDRTKYLLINEKINHIIMPVFADYYAAVSLGLEYAFLNDYESVVEYDDKGVYSIDNLRALIAKWKSNPGVNLVLASRFASSKPPHSLRWFGTRVLRGLAWLITKKTFTDLTMRLKLYDKNAIYTLVKYRSYQATPDTIVQLVRSGFTFDEAHVVLKAGTKKQSKGKNLKIAKNIFIWSLSIIFVKPFFRFKGE